MKSKPFLPVFDLSINIELLETAAHSIKRNRFHAKLDAHQVFL
ncbi:hypothetical protein [Planococcus donghaensis]